MEYLLRFIPLLVFMILFRKAFKNRNGIAITVIGLYVLSVVSSLFMNEEVLPKHDFRSDSLWSFSLFAFLLYPFLKLSLEIKPLTSDKQLPKGRLTDALIVILVIAAIYSIIYLFPYWIKSLSLGALYINRTEGSILPSSILTTIAVGFPIFYYLYVFLFFTSLVQKRHKLLTYGLFLGPIAFILNTLVQAKRSGVLLFVFALVLGFFYFRQLLTKKQIRLFKRSSIITGIAAMIPIYYFTIERFSLNASLTTKAFKRGVLSYFGQQPFIFGDWLNKYTQFDYGRSRFARFRWLVGQEADLEKGITEASERTEAYTWSFGTFLTAFYQVNGYISLFLISFLFWLFFKMGLKRQGRMSALSVFLFMGVYFHFMISGVFYYRLGNPAGNMFLLLSIILIFVFNGSKKIRV